MREYPKYCVHMKKLENNMEQIISRCTEKGIDVAGIVKGCNAIPEVNEAYVEAGIKMIGSSRMNHIRTIKAQGIKTPTILVRIPTLGEVEEVIELIDISLNSEVEVMKALNKEAGKQGKKHKVIIMVDLGDLREGFWDKDELVKTALVVENELENLELLGVGTNLGCYGAVTATTEKLNELVEDAEKIEKAIGRELKYISGGATTSLPRILEDNMPERINMLRIGEGILNGRDLIDLWKYDMDYMYTDTFTLKAEIMEVKVKPTHPVGEIMFDAFGYKPKYEDRGNRKRALIGIGKFDYGSTDMIFPIDPKIQVVGASSDHTILDIEDTEIDYKVGDIIEFKICYASMLYLTNSPDVKIEIFE